MADTWPPGKTEQAGRLLLDFEKLDPARAPQETFLFDHERRQSMADMMSFYFGGTKVQYDTRIDSAFTFQTASEERRFTRGKLSPQGKESDTKQTGRWFTLDLTLNPGLINGHPEQLRELYSQLRSSYHEFLQAEGHDLEKQPLLQLAAEAPATIEEMLQELADTQDLRVAGLIDTVTETFQDERLISAIRNKELVAEAPEFQWTSLETALQELNAARQEAQAAEASPEAHSRLLDKVSNIEASIAAGVHFTVWSSFYMRYKAGGLRILEENATEAELNCVGVGRRAAYLLSRVFEMKVQSANVDGHTLEVVQLSNGRTLPLDHGPIRSFDPKDDEQRRAWMEEHHRSFLILVTENPDEVSTSLKLARLMYRTNGACWYTQLAGLTDSKKDIVKGITAREIGILTHPKDVFSRRNLATYLRNAAAHAEDSTEKVSLLQTAAELCATAEEVAPKDPWAWQAAAGIWKDLGEREKAQGAYEKTLATTEAPGMLPTLSMYSNFASYLIEEGAFAQAHAVLERAARVSRERNPQNLSAALYEQAKAYSDELRQRPDGDVRKVRQYLAKQQELLLEAINQCKGKTVTPEDQAVGIADPAAKRAFYEEQMAKVAAALDYAGSHDAPDEVNDYMRKKLESGAFALEVEAAGKKGTKETAQPEKTTPLAVAEVTPLYETPEEVLQKAKRAFASTKEQLEKGGATLKEKRRKIGEAVFALERAAGISTVTHAATEPLMTPEDIEDMQHYLRMQATTLEVWA